MDALATGDSVLSVSEKKQPQILYHTSDLRLFFMVETAELESATPCMSSKYSNQLSYASITEQLYHTFLKKAIPF